MIEFYAYLNRMKYIKRWALMRSTKEENIMEHSFEVTVVAHALAVIKNKLFNGNVDIGKTVLIAEYHEVSEVITGDLPTPIKYFNREINSAYKELEKGAAEKLLSSLPDELKEEYKKYVLPDESSEEYKIAKYADKISAYIKCVEELKVGNKEFAKAEKTIYKEIKGFNAPEVDYFIKNVLPVYSLTLDELD